MRRALFAIASLLLLLFLVALASDMVPGAFTPALLANLAVVAWSSFVLPLRGLPGFDEYFKLRRWESSGRLYRALGVTYFRRLVRRGPLSIFNRALPAAWHSADVHRIERETRAAEAGHAVAFGFVLTLAIVALFRGHPERAVWLAALDVPLNLYPVLLQRSHRLRLADQVRHWEFGRGGARPVAPNVVHPAEGSRSSPPNRGEEVTTMTIQLTERQAELLLELLEVEHREQIHGLHHTLTSDYKKLLKERIAEIEKLAELLRSAEHAVGA